MTLFLTEPGTYEGGELVVEDYMEEPIKIKLAAGDMVLYPSGLIHSVTPVTKGERIAAISWAESEIEDPRDRQMVGKLTDVLIELEQDYHKHKGCIAKILAVQTGLLKKFGK